MSRALPEIDQERQDDVQKYSSKITLRIGRPRARLLDQKYQQQDTMDFSIEEVIRGIVKRYQYMKLMQFMEAFEDQIILNCKN